MFFTLNNNSILIESNSIKTDPICKNKENIINNSFMLNDESSTIKHFSEVKDSWCLDDRYYLLSNDSSQYISLGVNYGGGKFEIKDVKVCSTPKTLILKCLRLMKC